MKKLLLFTVAAALLAAAPPSFAHDDRAWHDLDNRVADLNGQLNHVLAQRDRFGSSPEIRDQISRLRFGVEHLNAATHDRDGDPGNLHKDAEKLSGLADRIESEYRDYEQQHVKVRVFHVW